MSKLIVSINKVFLILNLKLINLVIILWNLIKRNFYKIFSWLAILINWIIILKLMNNFLNFELLYDKLIIIIKLLIIKLIKKIIIFIYIIWYLKALFVSK